MIYGIGAATMLDLSERAWASLEEALAYRGWAKDPESVRAELQNLINEIRALRQRLAQLPESAYARPPHQTGNEDLI